VHRQLADDAHGVEQLIELVDGLDRLQLVEQQLHLVEQQQFELVEQQFDFAEQQQ
jgi:hypothetical protein